MNEDTSKKDYQNLIKENLKLKTELQVLKGERKGRRMIGNWISKMSTNFFLGKGLKGSMLRLYQELPEGKVTKVTLADVSSHLIWRMTRIGIFAFMIGIIPLFVLVVQTYILNSQNNLLSSQNQLLTYQNKRLDQQINLEEGSRRSSLIFLMSNVMDQIGEELKKSSNRKRVLSDELIGRIVSLSQAMRPYRYLENDQLIEQPLSPERGQLLFSLSNSLLSIDTYDKLFARADFSYADLKNANFNDAYLEGAKLQYANLKGASFRNADLEYADLYKANLEGVRFEETYMKSINLSHAFLRKSTFKNVQMTDATLILSDFTGAFLSGDFRRSIIDGIDLDNVNIGFLDIEGIEIHDKIMASHIDTNDVASIFEVSGRSYLNENFAWKQQFVQDGNLVDTFFVLTRKKESTLSTMDNCRKKVLEIIKSAKKIKQIEREIRKKKEHLIFLVEANPFGDQRLGIATDSVYTYRMTTEEAEPLSAIAWIEFDPTKKRMKSISPEDTILLNFNRSLLKAFPLECQ